MSYRLVNVILATLLSALAAVIAYASFKVILEEEKGYTSTLGPLQRGNVTYRLVPRSLAMTRKCFGELNVAFNPDLSDKQIAVSGFMRLSYRGAELTTDIRGEANFNPIGQLGGSLLSIKMNNTEMQVGTRNINPITLSLRTLGDAAKYNFRFAIPGPIELRRHTKDTYSLASPLFRPLTSTLTAADQSKLAGAFPLLVNDIPRTSRCDPSDQVAYSVESFMASMSPGASIFNNPLVGLLPNRGNQ